MLLQRPSRAVRIIKRLPAKELTLRLWNRIDRLRGRRIVETVFGAKMSCDPKDIIQASIVHFGVWEPEITGLFESLVHPGDVALDVGANVGYYSLLFAKRGAKAIAIEADWRSCERIKENVALNDADIRIVNLAVSDASGFVPIYLAPATNIGMTTTRPGRFTKRDLAPASTLMQILEGEDDLGRISLIKIDIEGAEAAAMREILLNLDRFSPRLAICVEADSDWGEAFDQLLAKGIRAYRVPNEMATTWRRLLYSAPETSLRPIESLPQGKADILLLRDPNVLPETRYHELKRQKMRQEGVGEIR